MSILDFIPYFSNRRNIPLEDLREVAIAPFNMGQAQEPSRSYANAADDGYRKNELVFACIQEFMTSASEARLIVGTRDSDGNIVEATGRPAELVRNPNPAMDIVAFLEAFHLMRLIGGNVFMFKPLSAIGTVSGLFLLRPDRVRVIPDKTTGAPAGWTYSLGAEKIYLPPEAISQHKMPDPLNDWYGMGPLQVLARQVNLDTQATEYARSFFENKGIPAGFLKVNRRIGTQEEADQIRRNWKARFAGKANWQQIGVLDEDADYKPIASNMKEMALKDLRNLTESRICSAFGIPPIIVGAAVGLDKATYANYASAKESMWEETMMPAYRRIAAFMTRALGESPEFKGMEFAFDFSEVRALSDDEKQAAQIEKIKADTASILIKAGYVPDSVGEALDLPDTLVHTGVVPPTGNALSIGDGKLSVAFTQDEIDTNVKRSRRLERVVDREYADSVKAAEEAIIAAFEKMGRRADGFIGAAIQRSEGTRVEPAFGISGETLIPQVADAELLSALLPELEGVAERTWGDITRTGVLSNISWTSHEGEVRNVLVRASERVTAINEATRTRINAALRTGVDRGYSLRQIAGGVEVDDFNGLRNIVRGIPRNPDAAKRARAIARTEVRWAQNRTTAIRYKASGVSEVIIRDGDEDEECAAVDGSRQTLGWYEDNPTQHPNCTRGATPVTTGLLL